MRGSCGVGLTTGEACVEGSATCGVAPAAGCRGGTAWVPDTGPGVWPLGAPGTSSGAGCTGSGTDGTGGTPVVGETGGAVVGGAAWRG